MTKHFSFSTDLIFLFFFSFLFLFSIFLIHLLFRKKFTGRIVGKKLSPGRSDVSKQFFLFGHIVILHKCTKNHDHMLYCSWDMACDRYNFFFSFWAFFCRFTAHPAPQQPEKTKSKRTKYRVTSSFYICVPKIMITWCTVPEIWCAMGRWSDRQTEKVTYRGGYQRRELKELMRNGGHLLIYHVYSHSFSN